MVHVQRDEEFGEWRGDVGFSSSSSPRPAVVTLHLNFLKGGSKERRLYMHGTKGTTSLPLPMLGGMSPAPPRLTQQNEFVCIADQEDTRR